MNLLNLKKILGLRRAHDSIGESILCQMIYEKGAAVFLSGNQELAYTITINKPDDTLYPVLWSCHTDTVHGEGGITQEIMFDDHPDMMLAASDGTQPLGADDGAGVWLLLEMIDANVPGTYIFHRGEEKGGIGSGGMTRLHFDWLKQFDHAIAFDRRGTKDIITHQARGRCCSDVFAKAFAALLGMGHAPSDMGVFTDTANYILDIPECTNVSCGYESEHTSREILDLDYLIKLRAGLISVFKDAPALPVQRHVDDPDDSPRWDFNYTSYKGEKDYEYPDDLYNMDEYAIADMKFSKLRKMVRDDPDGATDLLIDLASRLIYNTEVQEDTDYSAYNDHLNVGLS